MKKVQRKKALQTSEVEVKPKRQSKKSVTPLSVNLNDVDTFYVRKNHTWLLTEKPESLDGYTVENYIPNAKTIFAQKTV